MSAPASPAPAAPAPSAPREEFRPDLIGEADAAGAPPAPPRPALLDLTPALAGAVASKAKDCLRLGTLGMAAELVEAWDGERPADGAPFDGADPASGRPFTTLAAFAARAPGTKDPVAVSAGAALAGIAVFESLARVLAGCPPLSGAAPLADLSRHLEGGPTAAFPHSRDDGEVVRLMIAVQGHRGVSQRRAGALYAGLDQALLVLLNKVPGLAARIDGCGFHMAQLYVDFLRSVGELATLDAREKRATLSEHTVLAKLRTWGYIWPQYALSEEALTSLSARAVK